MSKQQLNALKVIATDKKIRAFLESNDPMALRQVDEAITAAESRRRPSTRPTRAFSVLMYGGETAAYSEGALMQGIYDFPIADGYGYYKVKSIARRGKDPIAVLVGAGPVMREHNGRMIDINDYGTGEKIVRVSELIRQREAQLVQEAIEAENLKRAAALRTDGTLYYMPNNCDKSGAWVTILAKAGNSITVKIMDIVGDVGAGGYYRIGAVHDGVGAQHIYRTREECSRERLAELVDA